MRANEAKAYATKEEFFEDKARFVRNFGALLSQTREGVKTAELIDDGTVVIRYKSGFEQTVNVACDSYLAIIKDVVREMEY